MLSDGPPPFGALSGDESPAVRVRPPGPSSRTWALRLRHRAAPMGSPRSNKSEQLPIVLSLAKGDNVVDVDGNRYVDFAQGFGSLLLGHGHPSILRTLELQAPRMLQALGDMLSADAKVALLERLAALYPGDAQVILGQSGADAVTAALKTAKLYTKKPGVVAFEGAYHGLSYGPLAICGLRESYREPFLEQLNPAVEFLPYPTSEAEACVVYERLRKRLQANDIGALVVEPILGRGGCLLPPQGFVGQLLTLAHERGALLISDEIWTGLGRAGKWLFSVEPGVTPDLICLGKGLGGGLPISACLGARDVMQSWAREAEVVHTTTFAGAPLACATAITLLNELERGQLIERSRTLGESFRARLSARLGERARVTGSGLMIGIDLGSVRGVGGRIAQALLERGYLVTSGGTHRETLVLTPALTLSEALVDGFIDALSEVVGGASA